MTMKSYDTKVARSVANMFVQDNRPKPSHGFILYMVRKHMVDFPEQMPKEVRAAKVYLIMG